MTNAVHIDLDTVLDLWGENTDLYIDRDDLVEALNDKKGVFDMFYTTASATIDCPDGVTRVLRWTSDDEVDGETVAANFSSDDGVWYLKIVKN